MAALKPWRSAQLPTGTATPSMPLPTVAVACTHALGIEGELANKWDARPFV